MASAEEFAHVLDLFEPMGPVRVRRMFGGAGVYAGDVMFALIAEGEVYLKTDDRLRELLEAEGSEPFLWTRPGDGRVIDMKYLRLPADAADDPEAASAWGWRALDVALKAKAARTPRRRKPG